MFQYYNIYFPVILQQNNALSDKSLKMDHVKVRIFILFIGTFIH